MAAEEKDKNESYSNWEFYHPKVDETPSFDNS